MLIEVPRVLRPGSLWIGQGTNREDLRLFLQAHQVNIEDVFYLNFHVKSFLMRAYKRKLDGTYKLLNRDVESYSATISYRIPPPKILDSPR